MDSSSLCQEAQFFSVCSDLTGSQSWWRSSGCRYCLSWVPLGEQSLEDWTPSVTVWSMRFVGSTTRVEDQSKGRLTLLSPGDAARRRNPLNHAWRTPHRRLMHHPGH